MLSKKECHLALKDIDNGKSPGSDGLSSERDDINLEVVVSINYGFEKHQMPICQKRGIITLVLEKDKPTNLLGNLRPISLLNKDYKIAMKANFTKRLEAVLPHVI